MNIINRYPLDVKLVSRRYHFLIVRTISSNTFWNPLIFLIVRYISLRMQIKAPNIKILFSLLHLISRVGSITSINITICHHSLIHWLWQHLIAPHLHLAIKIPPIMHWSNISNLRYIRLFIRHIKLVVVRALIQVFLSVHFSVFFQEVVCLCLWCFRIHLGIKLLVHYIKVHVLLRDVMRHIAVAERLYIKWAYAEMVLWGKGSLVARIIHSLVRYDLPMAFARGLRRRLTGAHVAGNAHVTVGTAYIAIGSEVLVVADV